MSVSKPKKPWFIHCTILKKINSKRLKCKSKNYKTSIRKQRRKSSWPWVTRRWLRYDQKHEPHQTKKKKKKHHRTSGKLKFIRIKNCCTTALQNTVERMKTQVAENILNHISDKELVTRNVDFSKLKRNKSI